MWITTRRTESQCVLRLRMANGNNVSPIRCLCIYQLSATKDNISSCPEPRGSEKKTKLVVVLVYVFVAANCDAVLA